MQFRFYIYNDSLAPTGTLIKQPLGWKDCALVLERHPDYHSLVEYFEGEFIFYGAGLTLIKSIEDAQGPDSRPRIVIEISLQINVWEQIYDGLLDLSLLEEFSAGQFEYKMKLPIVRNDFWTKFINRKSIPVNLADTVDIDGEARTPVSSFTLPLPSQAVNTSYRAEMYQWDDPAREPIFYAFDSGILDSAASIELPIKKVQEVENVYELPAMILNITGWASGGNNSFSPNFVAKYAGTYAFEINLVISTSPYSVPYTGGNKAANLSLRIYRNGVFISNATSSSLGVNGVDGRTIYHYSNSFDLIAGDSISYILALTGASSTTYAIVFDNWFANETSFVTFEATTLFEDSECESFKIKDTAESILSKIVGADAVLESDTLDACNGKYSLQKGLHIRGFSLADKPIAMSFDDWWAGADPIFTLGLGYTGDDKIKIETRDYFYNAAPSLNLSNVNGLIRSYDTNRFLKSIQIGYEKGLVESVSGIDDPQTKRTWRTVLASLGKDEKALSKFVAASLAIEETRRQSIEEGKDWKMDEEIFIIALNSLDEVEVGTAFDSVTNLNNSDTRYNIRLSCARNLIRRLNWITSSIQHDPSLVFKYVTGEGNNLMQSALNSTDCEYDSNHTLAENQDIAQGTAMFTNKVFTFNHPLSWSGYKTIRDNPERAIGVTPESSGEVKAHFILTLKYYLAKGYADFRTLLHSEAAVTGGIFDETFDQTFE